MKSHKKFHAAFTIVELLIVVVVIAILATITVIAYNGITTQAKDSALKSDLSITSKKLHLEKVDTGSYPPSKPSYAPSTIQYTQTSGGQGFCATASKDGKAFSITHIGVIQSGACTGHSVAGSGSGTEIVANSLIQGVTSAQCAALPTFTGNNTNAIRTVIDIRGGTTRTYEIAKLADNKCWMLTNLKLGSTAGSITLTPGDTNIANTFSLPQLNDGTRAQDASTNPGNDYDTPYIYGPIPGDTGSGETNYGYLYNWSAATAGETRISHDQTKGNAPYSICPANWRLPTGGTSGTVEFPMLNAKMSNSDATTGSISGGSGFYQNWQHGGAFKGVFSGSWNAGVFQGQSSIGHFWSRSVYPTDVTKVRSTYIKVDDVHPGNGGTRILGYAVRCLMD